MKIAVMGGTGLIGSQVVTMLNAAGHEAVPHSPSSGVDLISGQGLAEALAARAVADVSVGAPLNGTRSFAGPEVFTLDELGRIALEAGGDQRTVVTDDSAGMFAAAKGNALIAKDDTIIVRTTYREWLARK